MRVFSRADWLVPALALLIAACASTQEDVVVTQPAAVVTTPAGTVAVPTEIATLHPALLRAWQGTDPNAFQLYFTENAVVVTPSDRYTGWSDIHARWITPVLPGMSKFNATPTAFTREGSDIVETGKYSFTFTREGKAEDIKGGYTSRWQRQADGSWRMVSVNITEDD